MLNLIKQNKDIHGLTFFYHTFLYTAYADDTTFFLKDKESVKKVMNVFDTFSIYSGLKPNKSKFEIAGIGVLKGVSMELCGMECIDLTKNSVKILGIHFSYNKRIENEENFINTFTAKEFSETRPFIHLSKHVFGSQELQKYLSYEAHSLFKMFKI